LTAGWRVDIVEDDEERANAATRRFRDEARVRVAHGRYVDRIGFEAPFDAALSTHALLHGTPPDIARAIAAVHALLRPGGAFFATIGSKRDPRFEKGRRIAPDTFASDEGSEAGVAHAYFDEAGVRATFAGFVLEDVAETVAGDAVGRWAHSEREAAGIVQWWVRAKRDQ
jgi:SAM-dependent methyltransferase